MAAKQFEELEVWQAAKEVVVLVYRLTKQAPAARDFGFKDQVQRAAVSIMSNIAEGFERGGNREFIQFLYIAKGSAAEVRSLLHVAGELGYIPADENIAMLAKLASVSRQLSGFIAYLERDLATQPRPTKS